MEIIIIIILIKDKCFYYIFGVNSWRGKARVAAYIFFLIFFFFLISPQRRIHFFLGEERDWAAASGGLTFSILSLKGVFGGL